MIPQCRWLTTLTAVFVALTMLSAGPASAGKLEKMNARMAVIQKQVDRAKEQVAKDSALRRLQGIQNRIAKLEKRQKRSSRAAKKRTRQAAQGNRLTQGDLVRIGGRDITVGPDVSRMLTIPPGASNLLAWGWPVHTIDLTSVYSWARGRNIGITKENLIVDLNNDNNGAIGKRYFASGMGEPTAAQLTLLRKMSDAVYRRARTQPGYGKSITFMNRFPICFSGFNCSFDNKLY